MIRGYRDLPNIRFRPKVDADHDLLSSETGDKLAHRGKGKGEPA